GRPPPAPEPVRECVLRGASLTETDLTGATFDRFTRWPAGFDRHTARFAAGAGGCRRETLLQDRTEALAQEEMPREGPDGDRQFGLRRIAGAPSPAMVSRGAALSRESRGSRRSSFQMQRPSLGRQECGLSSTTRILSSRGSSWRYWPRPGRETSRRGC